MKNLLLQANKLYTMYDFNNASPKMGWTNLLHPLVVGGGGFPMFYKGSRDVLQIKTINGNYITMYTLKCLFMFIFRLLQV